MSLLIVNLYYYNDFFDYRKVVYFLFVVVFFEKIPENTMSKSGGKIMKKSLLALAIGVLMTMLFRNSLSSTIFCIKAEIWSMLSESKYKGDVPPISFKAPSWEHKTGMLQAIASRIGKPTPSFTDGKRHASAPA